MRIDTVLSYNTRYNLLKQSETNGKSSDTNAVPFDIEDKILVQSSGAVQCTQCLLIVVRFLSPPGPGEQWATQ